MQREERDDLARSASLSTEQLYRAHRPFVARFLTRLGVRPDALDDAVQDVFVTVHRRGGYTLGPAKPTSYLATIAVNTAAAQRRQAKTQRARRAEQEPEQLAAEGDPAHALESREALRQLDQALARLEPTLRETLLRADGEGETCVAISQASGVPVGTVYWRLDRARKKFREAVQRVHGDARATGRERRLGIVLALLGFGREGAGTLKAKLLASLGLGAVAAALVLVVPPPDVARTLDTRVEPLAGPGVRTLAIQSAAPALEPPAATQAPLAAQAPLASQAPRATQSPRVDAEAPTRPTPPARAARRASLQAPSAAPPREAVASLPVAPERAREEEREASEALQLARAEALLATRPREALELVRSIDAREQRNYLREERDYVELMAELQLDARRGRELARSFLHRYPASAFARVVRAKSALP